MADTSISKRELSVGFTLSLIFALLTAGASARGQVNLLPQGDFVNPGVSTDWAEGFNIPNNEEFKVVVEDGKHCLRIENHDATRQLDYVHAFVKVTPAITSLTVSVRMKASNVVVGKEGWHVPCVALMFEGGSFGYPPEIPRLDADSDWVTKTVELKVPKGATRLNIAPALMCCTGVLEISDLTVTPHMLAPPTTQLSDAVLPEGVNLNWDKADVTTVNAKRAQVSLDGVWHFIPVAQGKTEPPKLGWAYIKVPGDWQMRKDGTSDFVALAGGPQWDLYDGARIASAWYERSVPIPQQWNGRSISLRFDRVCTDAIVYVNGTQCGKVGWPWGSVDITSAVKPGETADVRVLVAAIADSEKVGSFWQNAFMNVTYSAAKLKTRGLTGDVYLESRSSEGHVTDIFVRPSTRQQNVSLDVELTGIKQAGQLHFTADMLNEKGEVEKSFNADAAVDAKDTQTVTLSWLWANPRLWEVSQPNLYTVRLTAKGPGVDDQYNQNFGFREFWSEGRQFYLNGTVIHLRQPCFYDGARGQVGDDFAEVGTEHVDARGDNSDAGADLDHYDRIGYLAACYILDAPKFIMANDQVVWQQNQQRAQDRAAVWMRHYRNHPSAVMWIAGFNFFNSSTDADPRHIGRGDWADLSDDRWKEIVAAGKEMFEALKKLDPTRVYYSHAGAYAGDVYSMNLYLDLIPLQEREDWLSDWAKSGEMPLTMTEFGTPVDCTFRRGHHGFESNITSEPLLTEFAAIYFGADAYSSEEPKYRQYLHSLFRGGMLYDSSENRLDEYADDHKIQQLYRTNTWRSWRTAGLGGGLRTWSWMKDALKEVNEPTLAWIAGPNGDYTAKDHHFSPGEKIDKQIVLINDTRQPQDFTATWAASVDGKEVDKGEQKGSLKVGEIRFIPIQVTAPAEQDGGKADGQITLNATIGQTTQQDAFAFRVFGADPAANGQIATVDPDGTSSNMLKSLGYTTHEWNGEAVPLLIVGRNALKDNPATLAKVQPYVQAGGRVLICAQDPKWLAQALGWRMCPDVTRRVFPVNSSLSTGIDADDMRDWTGSSTLIDAYPQYVGDYLRGNERDQPYAGWHWGNRGGVSSGAIEKPHRSGWRPLLECEFDLAYTPLMELDYGKGRLIVCTLDLEDHVAVDPAARHLAGHIMNYALQSPLSRRAEKVAYIGGDAGAAWLDRIGVTYQKSATLDAGSDLVLVGSDATIDDAALNAYLQQGGKAFFLPRSQAQAPLGVTLKSAEAHFAGSLSVPQWPQASGLSASDLRWRTFMDTPPMLVSAGADIGADGLVGSKTIGKGVAIFCQIDPDAFHADEKTYFRYTRWRSTRAVAQLLTNLGATFPVDSQIFNAADFLAKGGLSSGDRPGPQATGPGLPLPAHPKSETVASPPYYYPDYRTDFPMGDNPYRYYRW